MLVLPLLPTSLLPAASAAIPERGLSHISESMNFSDWILQSVATLSTCALIPRLKITSIFGALTTVIALAFVNATIWNAALFFEIPRTLTMQSGLLFLANGIIFWILVKILPGIEVNGFLPALIAPVVFTFCSLAVDQFHDKVPWKKIIQTGYVATERVREYFERTTRSVPR